MRLTTIKSRLFLQQFFLAKKSSVPDGKSKIFVPIFPLFLILCSSVIFLIPGDLSTQGRVTIFTFVVAGILWSTTKINAAYVALGSVLFLVLSGGISQEKLFTVLSSDVIWLMIGTFILGSAVKETGLAARLTQLVTSHARNVRSLFWLLTTILIPLAFLIPSTSGRAAVTLPIFQSIASATSDNQVRRSLSLLIPTVILVSTISSLVGAGSHLIALDLLEQISNKHISFGEWALYGLPFGIVASYISCWLIMRMFLNPRSLQQKLVLEKCPTQPFTLAERQTLVIVILMVVLWLTEKLHGLEIATVSVFGAMLLTMPRLGVMKWQLAIKAVSWNLIIFVGAALVLGRSLISSGASDWIIRHIFHFSQIRSTGSHFIIFLLLALISLTSHIYMTSHTARAAALLPPLLYLASSLDINPVAVLFISTLGMDYCLTFPISSKALMVYQDSENHPGFQAKDLMRLSGVLILVHLFLMVLFYYTWWHWLGLSL